MGMRRRIRIWRQRLAALLRRFASTLERAPAGDAPRRAAKRREAGPPAHWLARIEQENRPLAWIGPEDGPAGGTEPEVRPAAAPALSRDAGPRPLRRAPTVTHRTPPATTADRAMQPPRRESPPPDPDRATFPEAESQSKLAELESAGPSQFPVAPLDAAPPNPPPVRRRGAPRILPPFAPRPRPQASAPEPVASQPVSPPPPSPAEEVASESSRQRAPLEALHVPKAPSRPRVDRVDRADRAAADDWAPRTPPRTPRLASPLPSPLPPRSAAPADAAPSIPREPLEHAETESPSNHRPHLRRAPRFESPLQRSAENGAAHPPPLSPPIVPPWPELAGRGAGELPPPSRASAPWPELSARDEEEAERSLEEIERAARLDALAIKLGEEPWNASPS